MGVAIAMGGMALYQGIMAGQQQKQQNAIQRAQFEEQEFQKKMQNQIKNRQIAQANAAKWMANRNIAKASNKARAEEEFWLGYNFDNSTGRFSRQHNKINEGIKTVMSSRNISTSSGTSRQLLRQSLEQTKRGLLGKRISYENAMLTAERKHAAMLEKRDFGYASQVKFMPGSLWQQSDSSIMTQALVTGVMSGVSTGAQTSMALRDAGYDPEGTQSQLGFLLDGPPSGGEAGWSVRR